MQLISLEFLIKSIYYILLTCWQNAKRMVQKFWTNLYSVSNKSSTIDFLTIFARTCTIKIWKQFASFFWKNTYFENNPMFWQSKGKNWVLKFEKTTFQKTETGFCYSNFEDSDKVEFTSLSQNRGVILLKIFFEIFITQPG